MHAYITHPDCPFYTVFLVACQIQKYSGDNARICLLRLLDAPDDHVRRPLLGDLIVSWVPGLSGRMSMTDRQLTSVGISNKLVAYLSRMQITVNYTLRFAFNRIETPLEVQK